MILYYNGFFKMKKYLNSKLKIEIMGELLQLFCTLVIFKNNSHYYDI